MFESYHDSFFHIVIHRLKLIILTLFIQINARTSINVFVPG